ncbi:hypothetical protein MTO96_013252 [Rhipicephalus appendiculatus]
MPRLSRRPNADEARGLLPEDVFAHSCAQCGVFWAVVGRIADHNVAPDVFDVGHNISLLHNYRHRAPRSEVEMVQLFNAVNREVADFERCVILVRTQGGEAPKPSARLKDEIFALGDVGNVASDRIGALHLFGRHRSHLCECLSGLRGKLGDVAYDDSPLSLPVSIGDWNQRQRLASPPSQSPMLTGRGRGESSYATSPSFPRSMERRSRTMYTLEDCAF